MYIVVLALCNIVFVGEKGSGGGGARIVTVLCAHCGVASAAAFRWLRNEDLRARRSSGAAQVRSAGGISGGALKFSSQRIVGL